VISTKEFLASKFAISDIGEAKQFLGITIIRKRPERKLFIHQKEYVEKLLSQFQMSECNGVTTPMEVTKDQFNITPDDQVRTLYQQIVGSLIYLSVTTRLDIAYAVMQLSRFLHSPSRELLVKAKRVLRYLKSTTSYGLLYSSTDNLPKCFGFSDADWASNSDRRSISGYIFMLCNAVITWKCKRQSVVSLSTMEAEYIAVSSAAQEAVWILRLLKELKVPINEDSGILIFEDNQACISLAKNPIAHARAKHIDIKYHFIRQCIDRKQVSLHHTPGTEMPADMLTKPLPYPKFAKFRRMAGLWDSISGEC
jgi:hypothetical protein